MLPALPSPLAVVCHDEGATRLILPWLDLDSIEVRAVMHGPAEGAWRARFGNRGRVDDIDRALDGAALLLSGTSLSSELEHRARLEAAARGVRAVGVIDHWIHYAARFQRDGRRWLPDEIWVCDAEAYALAAASFEAHDIRLQPNLHLHEQVTRLAPCPDPRRHPTVLLLAEGRAHHRGPAADEAGFDFLIAHAERLGLTRPLHLRLRPAADDEPGRWDLWIDRHRARHDIAVDTSPCLLSAMDPVAWVAGFESTDLVTALASGRRVLCLQPPGTPRARLPHRGLIHLRDLVDPSR